MYNKEEIKENAVFKSGNGSNLQQLWGLGSDSSSSSSSCCCINSPNQGTPSLEVDLTANISNFNARHPMYNFKQPILTISCWCVHRYISTR